MELSSIHHEYSPRLNRSIAVRAKPGQLEMFQRLLPERQCQHLALTVIYVAGGWIQDKVGKTHPTEENGSNGEPDSCLVLVDQRPDRFRHLRHS